MTAAGLRGETAVELGLGLRAPGAAMAPASEGLWGASELLLPSRTNESCYYSIMPVLMSILLLVGWYG